MDEKGKYLVYGAFCVEKEGALLQIIRAKVFTKDCHSTIAVLNRETSVVY